MDILPGPSAAGCPLPDLSAQPLQANIRRDAYLCARYNLARLVAGVPRVPECDPDDHTDEERAVLKARLKNMAADALAFLDAMYEDSSKTTGLCTLRCRWWTRAWTCWTRARRGWARR
jgi:hypothetical protein